MKRKAKENRSFIQIDESFLQSSPTVEVVIFTSGITQNSLIRIYASSSAHDFMITFQNGTDIPKKITSSISHKVDRAVQKIHDHNKFSKAVKITSPTGIQIPSGEGTSRII